MNLLITLFNVLNRLVYLYTILLVVYALMSWFPGAYQSRFGQLLGRICEPFLNLFRRLPLQFAGIDFSIMVAILALNIVMEVLQKILINLIF
ncbi:YggT family protein [Enterococcus xiangfangensis]|uniref:YggT family protein n=1 Tax=Enterococcus xiangfangensis TaxID=1296537 RepID=A0ABU3F6U5_9ENTE|nr:YggT family protein [Enterococcus xiangfangensis]MBM7710586.1 YggT family protein [Enterococcus xiangfangensis]MDT2758372.1 YggT family protein [Enterococcus xiangfangensis]NBK09169.1 YggT family protein [Enterococcus asini]